MDKSMLRYVVVILVVLVVLGLIGLRVMRKVEGYGEAMAKKEMATQMMDTARDMVGAFK